MTAPAHTPPYTDALYVETLHEWRLHDVDDLTGDCRLCPGAEYPCMIRLSAELALEFIEAERQGKPSRRPQPPRYTNRDWDAALQALDSGSVT